MGIKDACLLKKDVASFKKGCYIFQKNMLRLFLNHATSFGACFSLYTG